MRISYNWMQEYGALHKLTPAGAPSPEEFAAKLEAAGYEVEGIERVKASDGIVSADDAYINLRIPHNRRDLTCMMWMAKELCGLYQIFYHDFALYGMYVPSNDWEDDVSDDTCLHLYSTTRLCRMMCGRVVGHAEAGETPEWYRDRAAAQGHVPSYNFEDLQVFVGRNVGQPLWLLDLAKLSGSELVATEAPSAGSLVAGGVTYAFEPGDLVLMDGDRPIQIAGVVTADEVVATPKTTSLVLYSAVYDPNEVRRVSERLGVEDFNCRLAKIGANAADVLKTMVNASGILFECAHASGFEALEIYNKYDMSRKFLTYTVDEINQLLSADFTYDEIKRALDNPELNTSRIDNERISTMFPSYRTDNSVCDVAQSVLCYLGCERIGAREG